MLTSIVVISRTVICFKRGFDTEVSVVCFCFIFLAVVYRLGFCYSIYYFKGKLLSKSCYDERYKGWNGESCLVVPCHALTSANHG